MYFYYILLQYLCKQLFVTCKQLLNYIYQIVNRVFHLFKISIVLFVIIIVLLMKQKNYIFLPQNLVNSLTDIVL